MPTEVERLVIGIEANYASLEKNLATMNSKLDASLKAVETRTTEMTQRVEGSIKNLGSVLGVGLSVSGVLAFTKTVVDNVAALGDQAAAAGVTVEQLQAYRAAAAEAGSSSDLADTALQRLTRTIGEAQAGNKELLGAFSQLGIGASQLAGGTTAVLPLVAQALTQITNTSERARIETELFGKSGQQIESVLGAWSQSADSLEEHFSKLGIIIDAATSERFSKAQGQWELFALVVQRDVAGLVASFGDLAQAFTGDADGLARFNDELARNILLLTNPITAPSAIGARIRGFFQPEKTPSVTVQEGKQTGIPNFIRPGLDQAPDIKVEYGPDIDAHQRALDEKERAERRFRDAMDRQRTRAVLEQVDADEESVRTTIKLEETIRKTHEDTLGEMSAADKAYFDERIRLEDKAANDAKRFSGEINRSLVNSIVNFGDEMERAGGKFGKAVLGMIADLAKLILKMELAKALENSIGAAGGGGGILRGIVGAVGGVFGGAGGAGSVGAAGVSDLPAFAADGANASAGQPFIIGERGPELFVPRVPGTIIPNSKMGGGGSVQVNIYQTVTGNNGDAALAQVTRTAIVGALAQVKQQFPSMMLDTQMRYG